MTLWYFTNDFTVNFLSDQIKILSAAQENLFKIFFLFVFCDKKHSVLSILYVFSPKLPCIILLTEVADISKCFVTSVLYQAFARISLQPFFETYGWFGTDRVLPGTGFEKVVFDS